MDTNLSHRRYLVGIRIQSEASPCAAELTPAVVDGMNLIMPRATVFDRGSRSQDGSELASVPETTRTGHMFADFETYAAEHGVADTVKSKLSLIAELGHRGHWLLDACPVKNLKSRVDAWAPVVLALSLPAPCTVRRSQSRSQGEVARACRHYRR